jgi:hypothetical protein
MSETDPIALAKALAQASADLQRQITVKMLGLELLSRRLAAELERLDPGAIDRLEAWTPAPRTGDADFDTLKDEAEDHFRRLLQKARNRA